MRGQPIHFWLIWLVCLLLCAVLSLSNLQITLAIYHKIIFERGRTVIFHLITCFFYLLYCNITSWISPKITLVLSFVTFFFAKWNFVFTLRNSDPAKTWPARPFAMALLATYSNCLEWNLSKGQTVIKTFWLCCY